MTIYKHHIGDEVIRTLSVLIVICVYTMAGALPIFPTFECEDLNNAGPRWTKWLSRFEVLLSAMDVRDTEPEKKRKKALLLHYMGAECYDIYETLKNEEDDYSAVKTKMNDYFVPKYNSEFEDTFSDRQVRKKVRIWISFAQD